MKHYLKINTSSETGKQISDFITRCNQADEQAREYAKSLGANVYYESPDGMSGGIVAIELPFGASIPEGWDIFSDPATENPAVNICVPSESNESVGTLPIVSETELFGILSLKPIVRNGKRLPMTFGRQTPVIFALRGFYYVTSPYESSSSDVCTISEKEYLRKKNLAMKS